MTMRQSTKSPSARAVSLPLPLPLLLPLDLRRAPPGIVAPGLPGRVGARGARSGQGDSSDSSAPDRTGYALGWDYAHYRSTPPAALAELPSPLRHGLLAGQAVFGLRTLAASRHVHTWLQLRLHAWQRGRSVEAVQVTPNYLQQIDVTHCPITREPLDHAERAQASVDRVRNDAGYAAGNLAVMSQRANRAKAALDFRAALQRAQVPEAPEALDAVTAVTAGVPLNPAQWARVATLCSLVEPLPHALACTLPMLLLPPNRLRLFNPVQALQAFVSLQFLKPGWARRMQRFTDLLPGAALQRHFRSFFLSLLARVLEAGKLSGRIDTRWAIEDAWRTPCVQLRWTRFASQLEAAQCEALLARAAAEQLATAVILPLTDGGAIDGWNLPNRGYLTNSSNLPNRGALANMGYRNVSTEAWVVAPECHPGST